MSKKITKSELNELIDQVRIETKIDLASQLDEIYGLKRPVPMDELLNEIMPKMLSTTFAVAGFHAEYLVHDVLNKLDLIKDDE